MGSVAAAARGQVRVIDFAEQGRKRSQGKKKREEDGEAAAHLELIVHEAVRGSGIIDSSI
jgi:hypothetical protein